MLKTTHVSLLIAFALTILMNTTALVGEDRESLDHQREHLRELTQEIANLFHKGKHEEAHQLQEELRNLMREYAEARSNSNMENSTPDQERKELAHRLGELARESHELRRSGKNEEANQVQQEMIELGKRMQQHRPQPKHQIPEEKKIDHLHLAAENLEAAGFHKEARELHQRAEQLREELKRHLREEHEEHEHNDHEHHEHAQAELIEQVEVLHNVIQQMQHQMRQMQEQLNHLRKELSDRRRPPAQAPQSPNKFSPPTPYQTPRIEKRPPYPFGDSGQTLPPPQKNPKGNRDLYRPVQDPKEKKATPERKKQRTPKPTNNKEVKEEFREVKEVVLSMNSMDFMLDLDSGKTMDPPQTYRPEQKSMDIVPLQPQPNQQPVALMGNSLSGFKGDPADWELSTKDLHKKLNVYPLSRLSKLTFDNTEAATYIYRTKEGAEGVLQLVELVDSPKGIRVRYRSLQ